MNKLKIIIFLLVLILISFGIYSFVKKQPISKSIENITDQINLQEFEITTDKNLPELSIENLRKGNYPGSDIVIEETLPDGSNYRRFYASYKSEGLKIYGLLTIPNGEAPIGGWPAIIFNHGYIPPAEYRTTERYVAYVDGFARSGYIVFRSDYRGHDKSEGAATGAYGSNGYTIDVLNAVSSVKKFKDVNPERIGMWGHSLGGFITLRSMVVRNDIKAGVIWAGVIGSYDDMLNNWRRGNHPTFPLPSGARRWRQSLIEIYGTPEQNPAFWNSISANAYLADISGPLQLHHGTADSSVPLEFSEKLKTQMEVVGKTVELYTYSGDDHDISNYFGTAMQRSVEFFDKYLKN